MKKLLALGLSTLFLASCGGQKEVVYEPFDAVVSGMQKELASEFEYKETPKIAQVKGGLGINVVADSDIDSIDFDLKGELKFDSKFDMNTGDSDTKLDGMVNAKVKSPEFKEFAPSAGDYQTVEASAKANVLTKDKKIYFALNDLDFDTSIFKLDVDEGQKMIIDQVKAQIEAVKKEYVNKYAYLTIPEALISSLDINKFAVDPEAVKKLKESFETKSLFNLVSENKEAKGDYYEYVVTLNIETVNALFKEYLALVPSLGEELPIDEIEDILTEETDEFTLKVNKTDKSDFVLEYAKDESTFKLESSKKKFYLEAIGDDNKIVVDLDIKGDLYKGNVMVNSEGEEIKFDLEFKFTEAKTYFKLGLNGLTAEGLNIKKFEFKYDTDTKELSKFEATLPEEATSLDQLVGAYLPFLMMGAGNPFGAMPSNDPFGY